MVFYTYILITVVLTLLGCSFEVVLFSGLAYIGLNFLIIIVKLILVLYVNDPKAKRLLDDILDDGINY